MHHINKRDLTNSSNSGFGDRLKTHVTPWNIAERLSVRSTPRLYSIVNDPRK